MNEILVSEIEPNLLLVKFHGPKPPAEKRTLLLHQVLRGWLAKHPGRAIRRTMPIHDEGELVGIHVWLGDAPEPRQRRFAVKIHHRLVDRLPAEHVEALLHDAYEVFNKHDGAGALALISRGGKAVVFDRATERCFVLPFDALQNLDKDAAEKLRKVAVPAGRQLLRDGVGGV